MEVRHIFKTWCYQVHKCIGTKRLELIRTYRTFQVRVKLNRKDCFDRIVSGQIELVRSGCFPRDRTTSLTTKGTNRTAVEDSRQSYLFRNNLVEAILFVSQHFKWNRLRILFIPCLMRSTHVWSTYDWLIFVPKYPKNSTHNCFRLIIWSIYLI